MTIDYEFLKIFGYIFVYPLMVIFMTTKIAKWHFEKDIKKQYLLAKDSVANELILAISNMLVAMWDLANTDKLIKDGKLDGQDKNVLNNIQNLYNKIHENTMASYLYLGKAGLYFGTNIVEEISEFQSELNNMISENNLEVFSMDRWGEYRRQKILPVLNQLHAELKGTVFDGIKSFRLYIT
ncbi:MAG: hypothetical protein OEY01_07085 [Desulfobulbaceae bacterium]|nr:hypothetical protein [Desulfobulbaceae bacterium]HIJ78820.1 hypothetical protein [Deltaproteobacteria bacterium]